MLEIKKTPQKLTTNYITALLLFYGDFDSHQLIISLED